MALSRTLFLRFALAILNPLKTSAPEALRSMTAPTGKERATLTVGGSEDFNRQTHTLIEHTPHISTEAQMDKLADKICDLRDILA